MKAEALHLADRTGEALEAIKEAATLEERSEDRWWSAELHRLRGVFLTAIGAAETKIEASFCAAIRIANDEVYFASGARRGNLRRIPPPKSGRVTGARIATTPLLSNTWLDDVRN